MLSIFNNNRLHAVIPSNGFNRQVNGYNVLNKVIVMCVLHYAKSVYVAQTNYEIVPEKDFRKARRR